MDIHGRGRPIEILLVEDNPADVRLTREAFKDGRVRNNLHVVEDGVQAMEFLRRQGLYPGAPHPDVILLDLKALFSDGHEVLRAIRQFDSSSAILLMSGEGMELKSLLDQSLREGARLCLHKPFQPAEVLELVAEVRVERAVRKLRG